MRSTVNQAGYFAVEIFDRKIFKNKNNSQCIYWKKHVYASENTEK